MVYLKIIDTDDQSQGGGYAWMYADEFQFDVIPEPATLGLLSLLGSLFYVENRINGLMKSNLFFANLFVSCLDWLRPAAVAIFVTAVLYFIYLLITYLLLL